MHDNCLWIFLTIMLLLKLKFWPNQPPAFFSQIGPCHYHLPLHLHHHRFNRRPCFHTKYGLDGSSQNVESMERMFYGRLRPALHAANPTYSWTNEGFERAFRYNWQYLALLSKSSLGCIRLGLLYPWITWLYLQIFYSDWQNSLSTV